VDDGPGPDPSPPFRGLGSCLPATTDQKIFFPNLQGDAFPVVDNPDDAESTGCVVGEDQFDGGALRAETNSIL